MAHLLNGLDVGRDVCEALGIEVEHTHSITIKIQPDDIVRIDVEQNMTNDQYNNLIKLVKHYAVVELKIED